jgi:phosphatidylserine/phosphatidylglycerophosphate/cardiolipin synthase-like enzyme
MASKRKTVSRSTSSDLSRQQVRLRQTITTILVLAVLLLGAYYLLTGSDPLGLFSPEPTPTSLASISNIAGSGGDWWQVYFTDPHTIHDPDKLAGSIPERLIGYINAAGQGIDVAAFEFNLTPVAEALIAAHERGVRVRWVTDDEHGLGVDAKEGHGQFKMLTRAGVEVRDDDREALMHNKFWIFDGQIVWTGSTNVTTNGNFRNNNNVVVIGSPQLAAIFEREFDEMWSGEFGPRSPSTVEGQALTIDGTPIQVLFAAEDEVMRQLVPLIAGAQSSIRFMAFSFTHDELGAAVLARASAGVDVKGIFETRGSETEYSELPALYCAGVPVRQDGNPGTFHHKVFVVDDKIVVTGSLNFSDNADESNDENVLVIANRDVAACYLQEFERRWAEATAPSPDDVKCK